MAKFNTISGSDPAHQFVIIAESDRSVLGIRAIIEVNQINDAPPLVFMGVRVRVIRSKGKVAAMGYVLAADWPGIVFSKIDKVRASAVAGSTFTVKGAASPDDLKKVLRAYYEDHLIVEGVRDWLVQHIAEEQFVLSLEDIVEVLTEEFHQMLGISGQESTEEINNVIPFKPKS